MKILVVNDDGVKAPGIFCLAKWLSKKHEVVVVAPESNRSFASRSMTIKDIVRILEVQLPGLEGVRAYAISGSPADCVTVGIGLDGFVPDVVISGINAGENLAGDILSSGTVGAAARASELGYPAAAISLNDVRANDVAAFETAGAFSLKVADMLARAKGLPDVLINVNVPNISEIRGVKLCAPGSKPCGYHLEERKDPYGFRYFWIAYEGMDVGEHESDTYYCEQGYITVTPLRTLDVDTRLVGIVEQCVEDA